jgi:hypothetical protein
LSSYYKHCRSKDGYNPTCKSCRRKVEQERKHLPHVRANNMWQDLNKRVRRQPEYNHVEVRMTRPEFMAFAVPALVAWLTENPDGRPSLDRCEAAGHYEVGNLRILALGDNARLRRNNHNVHAPKGQAWCSRCRCYLPRTAFGIAADRPHGLQSYCKACRSASRPRRRNPNHRNDQAPDGASWCGGCLAYLPRDQFYACSTGPTGLQTKCKACQARRAAERNSAKQR